jgi:NADPH-dependent 2,4-dienoyl-CoA reductase/sulfur reductase-like enzyme
MAQFKDGKRHGHVMHQIAKGYSDARSPLADTSRSCRARRNAMERFSIPAGVSSKAAPRASRSGSPDAPAMAPRAKARVVVVGGGYGGATAAKYIRMLDPAIEVTVVEPNEAFVSCPISNLVLGGFMTLADITTPYTALVQRHGVRWVRDTATAIDMEKKQVRLAKGDVLAFEPRDRLCGDRLHVGIFACHGNADAQNKVLHAWKAGPQTVQLRRQLEAMPDGGVYVLSIPEAPYRCPPGPYERACQVAAYFKAKKPRSKVLLLDANGDVTSKGPLFKKAWAELYKDIIEYRPNSKATDVDLRAGAVKTDFGDVKGDVLNVLPPMKAGTVATPFITANKRWCEVDWLTYESKAVKGAHILGDSLQIAPAMPKSATMANGHGKVCAAAVVAMLNGQSPNESPTLINTCYSMVSDKLAIHVASVHKYDTKDRTMKAVPGAGGVSPAMNEAEGGYSLSWARNIWADTRWDDVTIETGREYRIRDRVFGVHPPETMKKRILILFPDEWDRAAAQAPRFRTATNSSSRDSTSSDSPTTRASSPSTRCASSTASPPGIRARRWMRSSPPTSSSARSSHPSSQAGLGLAIHSARSRASRSSTSTTRARRSIASCPSAMRASGCCAAIIVTRGSAARLPLLREAREGSVLGSRARVDSFAALQRHTRFGWFERAVIERLVQALRRRHGRRTPRWKRPLSMFTRRSCTGAR